MTTIINPTSGEAARPRGPRTVVADLAGRSIGFLSNSKMNADVVLEAVAEALVARFGVSPRLYVKRVPSISAELATLDEIGRDCAAAVVAMLDCGSCASWAVADMVELSKRGLAVCGVASDQFDGFSRQVLELKDAGELGLAVIEHPVGGIPPAQAKARVSAATVDAVIQALTGRAPAGVGA